MFIKCVTQNVHNTSGTYTTQTCGTDISSAESNKLTLLSHFSTKENMSLQQMDKPSEEKVTNITSENTKYEAMNKLSAFNPQKAYLIFC